MKKALTAAMLLGLGASAASAQLLGSDTLFEMINDPDNGILRNCPAAAGLSYLGQGSTQGETGMRNDAQEIAPMSRFLNAGAANTCRTPSSGCYLGALDALSVFANTNNTDGLPGTGGTCDTVNYGKALPSGYVVDDWRTALRLVYGGQEAQIINYDACAVNPPPRSGIATKNCASTVRAELINNWGNLFQNACNDGDCTQLKHAFRRDDVSGTTDVFVELLALSAIGTTPFCNGNDTQDTDPVRRTCDGQGRGTTTVAEAVSGEQVCQRDGTLGVVLPMVIPTLDPYLTSTVSPPVAAVRDRGAADCATSWEADQDPPLCSPNPTGGLFQKLPMPPGTTTCPVGNISAGLCLWPKVAGSAPGTGFSCLNGRNNLPGTIPPGSQDGRAWNLFPRRNTSGFVTYTRGTSSVVMKHAFYRLHMTAQLAAGDRPTAAIPATTINGVNFAARSVAQGCQFADSTEQIGCLIEASPCSIGYAGNSAASPNAECGSAANRRALALETPAGGGIVAQPTDVNVRRFLDTAGPGCAAAGDFDQRYPLSRGLWMCTSDGVPTAAGTGTTTGTQTPAYLTQQNALATCWQSRTIIDQAVNATGFITLDTTGATPVGFRSCP